MINCNFGQGQPVKLIVSGLHGKEHETTDVILKAYKESVSQENITGKVVLRSLERENREYISTLDEKYWDSESGKELLSIIENFQPSMYTELHSYSESSKLTDPKRIKRKGVPPLIELESGILAGSVAPYLRTSKFQKEDFCFLLEIPRKKEPTKTVLNILKIISRGKDREEIVEKLKKIYPKQIEQMKKYYELFYKNNLSSIQKLSPSDKKSENTSQ